MLRALTQLAGKQPKLCGGWPCGARMAFHSARPILSDGDDGGAISEADLRPLAEVRTFNHELICLPTTTASHRINRVRI
jgi:hypothetical protein